MAWGGLQNIDLRVLDGKVKWLERNGLDIIEEFFMLYKSMNIIWNGSCEQNHTNFQ
jgi:hypothetical protein